MPPASAPLLGIGGRDNAAEIDENRDETLGSSKMEISLNTRIVVSPEVLMQEISGESVLLDLKSESYFGLDEVGTRIWRLIERDGELMAVHAALLAEYDVDAARLERDLKELIGRLVNAGLVAVRTANEQEA